MNSYWRLLTLTMMFGIAQLLLCQETTDGREPLSPSDEEVAAHLIGRMPVIRMDFSKFKALQRVGAIPVKVVVDEVGNVTSAKLEDHDDDIDSDGLTKVQREIVKAVVAEAEKTGMNLHFRPFEDNGHAASAQFEIEIPVRALEEQSAKSVTFPQIHEWNSVKIMLSRTGCLGVCPGYEVEIHGDGTVLYNGGSFVAISDRHRVSISRNTVLQLVEAFRATDYFSLKDEYIWGATDLPTYTTSISLDGKAKRVVDYAGLKVGMPEKVSRLEQIVDSLSGVERWTKGNSETVAALMQEKFDFRSPEASEILAKVAQMGSIDAVRDLVAAGVVISTKPSKSGFGARNTALGSAAHRGEIEMLRVLLSAGVNDPDEKTRALESAASAGKQDAMRLLIESGANPLAPDVLIGAATSGIPAVVEQILKYGPDANRRGTGGATALIACLQAYHHEQTGVNVNEVIRLLLAAGSDPNIADDKGETPLILNSRDLQVAQMLIAHGANVNARAKDGFTPLLNAETIELTRLLLEHGADPFAKTEQGETALDWARKMNRKAQMALLQGAMTGKTQ
jgi:ankyrin repeat protein